jgi:urease accessory protein
MWPGRGVAAASAVPGGAPWPLAFAAVAADAGVGLEELSVGAASATVTGPAWAATRLLGLDPYEVARCLAELAVRVQAVASASRRWGRPGLDPADLPAGSAPLLDIGAERHATREARLFAS